ncbi:hypothetical protein BCR35DRAFT_305162 [Leucosporidium creatinivorum]|uniref:Proteophosphoglycan ppg4 n=1 Tax=Leucosporidium creatinivorum TaxID=106004 RepID=A0A1Y2F3F4_9BASI|nr:hypothetical protein BCR35DRAFT_305162 [Leucosporidium creatinivorum]
MANPYPGFHLSRLDFSLEELASLPTYQLALVAFHPLSTQEHRERAELLWGRARERDRALGRTIGENEEAAVQAAEEEIKPEDELEVTVAQQQGFISPKASAHSITPHPPTETPSAPSLTLAPPPAPPAPFAPLPLTSPHLASPQQQVPTPLPAQASPTTVDPRRPRASADPSTSSSRDHRTTAPSQAASPSGPGFPLATFPNPPLHAPTRQTSSEHLPLPPSSVALPLPPPTDDPTASTFIPYFPRDHHLSNILPESTASVAPEFLGRLFFVHFIIPFPQVTPSLFRHFLLRPAPLNYGPMPISLSIAGAKASRPGPYQRKLLAHRSSLWVGYRSQEEAELAVERNNSKSLPGLYSKDMAIIASLRPLPPSFDLPWQALWPPAQKDWLAFGEVTKFVGASPPRPAEARDLFISKSYTAELAQVKAAMALARKQKKGAETGWGEGDGEKKSEQGIDKRTTWGGAKRKRAAARLSKAAQVAQLEPPSAELPRLASASSLPPPSPPPPTLPSYRLGPTEHTPPHLSTSNPYGLDPSIAELSPYGFQIGGRLRTSNSSTAYSQSSTHNSSHPNDDSFLPFSFPFPSTSAKREGGSALELEAKRGRYI